MVEENWKPRDPVMREASFGPCSITPSVSSVEGIVVGAYNDLLAKVSAYEQMGVAQAVAQAPSESALLVAVRSKNTELERINRELRDQLKRLDVVHPWDAEVEAGQDNPLAQTARTIIAHQREWVSELQAKLEKLQAPKEAEFDTRVYIQPASFTSTSAAMDRYQTNIGEWVVSTWDVSCLMHKHERVLRFCEEAIELCQACELDQSEVFTMVNYVYARDRGEVHDEVGGVINTLSALCAAFGESLGKCASDVLDKCWLKQDRIKDKHAKKPGVIRAWNA